MRWSKGPEHDADETSRDHASGLDLPGLAANPLGPPGWWTLPLGGWVARQITTYAHLGEDAPDHVAWVLTGRVVDRGPDNEPLVADVLPVAPLSRAVLYEAEGAGTELSTVGGRRLRLAGLTAARRRADAELGTSVGSFAS